MISAFGVEHGEFSKGLPSALRSPERKLTKFSRSWDRVVANQYGRDAARMSPQTNDRTIDSGRNVRALVRRHDMRDANKKKKRVLP